MSRADFISFIILLELVLFKLALKFCILENLVQNSMEV